MASTIKNTPSSIGMALAGLTASVDIPKPRHAAFWTGKDSFAAVAARSLPGAHRAGLPTPPNSISPTLPPHGFKDHIEAAPPTPPAQAVESDIDLQDAVDHANAQDQPQRGLALAAGNLASLENTGAITPGMLAKHHLPDILLDHGPLAIRHVMGYLTTSVPGFSGIPPAKARRLVVGALEGRGSGGEGAGINGDVEFEKVGWGRWDARRRGQLPKHDRSARHLSPTATRHPLPSLRSPSPYATNALRIPHRGARNARKRLASYGSTSHLMATSHDSRSLSTHMLDHETEADKMSLDGSDDASCSSSEAPDEDPIINEEAGDATDEEDWASIGAAALRQGSFPRRPGGHMHSSYNYHAKTRQTSGRHLMRKDPSAASSATNKLAQSAPLPGLQHVFKKDFSFGSENLMEGMAGDDQDLEAVQALMRLGSV